MNVVGWIGVGASRFLVGAGVSSVSDGVGIVVVGKIEDDVMMELGIGVADG